MNWSHFHKNVSVFNTIKVGSLKMIEATVTLPDIDEGEEASISNSFTSGSSKEESGRWVSLGRKR